MDPALWLGSTVELGLVEGVQGSCGRLRAPVLSSPLHSSEVAWVPSVHPPPCLSPPEAVRRAGPVRILCKVEGAVQVSVAVPRHWLSFGRSWLLLRKKGDSISFTEVTEFSTTATFCTEIRGCSHVTHTKGRRQNAARWPHRGQNVG